MSVPVRKRNLSSLEFYNTAVMTYKDIVSILSIKCKNTKVPITIISYFLPGTCATEKIDMTLKSPESQKD